MIKRIFYKISILVFLTGISVAGATQTGVTIKASVDKNTILIGEHFTLRMEADIPENEAIRFFAIDTLAHFEFLEKQKIDTSNTSTGTVLVQLIRMTSFDSGRWVIPRFFLDETRSTDSIIMDVGFSTPFDSTQAYHDIKDVIDVQVKEEKEWWWYAAAGTLLALVLIWFLLRKKNPPVKAAVVPVNPYEEAMSEIEKLRKHKPEPKQYYSSLVDIFRLYIARKKGINSLQKTTDDLVVQLRSQPITKENFDRLAQALRLSDFVKFAKYQPGLTDDDQTLTTIRETIMAIEQSEPVIVPGGS